MPTPLLEQKLNDERLRNSGRMLVFRAVVTFLWLIINAFLAEAKGMPGPAARAPLLGIYFALAVALLAAARAVPAIRRHSWLALPLLDLPLIFAIQLQVVTRVPERATLVALVTMSIDVLVLICAQLSIRRANVVVSALVGYVLLLVLFAASSAVPSNVWVDALMVLGGGAALATYLMARNLALLRELGEEHQAVVELNSDLEARVAERTREVERALAELKSAQSQLVHAEKMASVGRLSAGVAHEINNPLNFIVNSLGPLKQLLAEARTEPQAEVDTLLRSLERGAQRTQQIVQGLTAFSRSDEGEELRDSDLARLLDDAVSLLRYELEPRIAVERSYAAGLRLRCFPGALSQLLVNLLANAAQSIAGTGTIKLATCRANGAVEISVEDNGAGIAPEVLPRIFEPFFTTREVGSGTGLGLSIAHGIAERHGGRIEVRSEPGKGSRFTVVLPARL